MAEELVEWKRASNSPRTLASRAGGMMTVGEGGGGGGGGGEGAGGGTAGVGVESLLDTSLVARAKATASPEAAPLIATAFLASSSALESSLAVSACSLATSSCRRSSCAERASSSATSAGVFGRDSEEEEPFPLEAAVAAFFSDCAGGLATFSLLLLLLLPEGEEEEAEEADEAATAAATEVAVRR